jgi:hypothetical protein
MVNVINRMNLVEVSLVSVPANPEAKAIGWYITKALEENPAAEGVKPMPEEVIVEKINPKNPPAQSPAIEPPKAKATAEPATPPPAVAAEKPPKAKDAFVQVQEEKLTEINKGDVALMKTQLEPVFVLLDKLSSIGGQAGTISHQIMTILKKLVGDPIPATPAPRGVSKSEVEELVASEVQKQMDAQLKALPTLRKGLIQQDTDADEVRKKFEKLSPDQKLRAALAMQEHK